MIIIDEAIKLINKFIPDKINQQQLEKELRNLDIGVAPVFVAFSPKY
ncbi:hypothetical protein [Fusobacterium ulcerans]|nr:hypothetical protein [Fusobacterium ulcerans]MEE0137974.1 hypothetical protein [Fusobacterium ulcerans]